MKKTQKVEYNGTGYFVVDLDQLKKSDIIEDKDKKTITIKINHSHLETVAIDPNNIKISDVDTSLLNHGKIKMTVAEFNEIEIKLFSRLNDAFNTPENAQTADSNALKSVKKIYEPIVKAIDPRYTVIVEFK